MADHAITITIGGKDLTAQAFKSAGENVKKLNDDLAKAGTPAGGGEQKGGLAGFAQQARQFQRENRLEGEMALQRMLERGPAGLVDFALDKAGVGLQATLIEGVGKSLGEMTGKLVEMRNALREGKADWASMTQSIMEGLPVVGGFATAGKNIRELITGEGAAIEETKKQTELLNDATKFRAELAADIKKSHEETLAVIASINRETARIGMKGPELRRSTERDKNTEEVEKTRREADNEIRERKAKLKGELDKLSTVAMGNDTDAAAARYQQDVLIQAVNQANAKTLQDRDAKLQALGEKRKKEEANTEKEIADERQKVLDDSEKRAQKIRDEVHQKDLQNRGEAVEAERAAAQSRADAELRELQERTKKAAENDPELKKAIEEKAADEAMAIRERLRVEQEGIDRKAADEKEKLTLESERKLAKLQSEVTVGALKEKGDLLGAHLEEIRQKYAEETARIDQEAQDKAGKDADNAPAIQAAAEEQKKLLGQKQAQDEAKARADAEVQKTASLQNLLGIEEQIRQKQAAAGDGAAALEAKRLKVAQEFLATRQKLLGIINAEGASEAEKARARMLLGQAETQAEYDLANIGVDKRINAGTASAAASRFLTGVAEGSRFADPQLAEARKANETAIRQEGLLRDILKSLTPAGTTGVFSNN